MTEAGFPTPASFFIYMVGYAHAKTKRKIPLNIDRNSRTRRQRVTRTFWY